MSFEIQSVHDLSGTDDGTEILIDIAYSCSVNKREGFTKLNILADCYNEDGELVGTQFFESNQALAEGAEDVVIEDRMKNFVGEKQK